MSAKELIYDWDGANVAVFRLMNDHHSTAVDTAVVRATPFADYETFPYYLAAILAAALLSVIWRKARGRIMDRGFIMSWVAFILAFCVGYAVMAGCVGLLKHYFEYPRPFVALQGVQVLGPPEPPDKYYRSFPSGHTAFATFLVAAFWPKLRGLGKICGVLLVLFIMYGRVAAGAHFPADVLAAMLLAAFVTILTRRIVYGALRAPYY